MKGTPKPERIIRVNCSDCFGTYTCLGKWVLYKGQYKKKGGRFMRQDKDGNWDADRKTWNEVNSWEYVEESKQ